MHKIYERNIDTNTDGLVFQIDHNLGRLPVIHLWEATTFGDMKYISLYDPRIDSFETMGDNSLKLSFTSEFKGFIQLITYIEEIDYNKVLERLNQRIDDLTINQKHLVAKSSWTSMNSYFESLIKDLQEKDSTLEQKIKQLENDILLL